MTQYAIWKKHTVIGYCTMEEATKEQLNNTPDMPVYFGYDEVTRPEAYAEDENQ